jgi:hypothetical protein
LNIERGGKRDGKNRRRGGEIRRREEYNINRRREKGMGEKNRRKRRV